MYLVWRCVHEAVAVAMDPNTWTQYYSRLNQVAAPQQEQPTYANAPQFLLAQQIRYERRRTTKEMTILY